MVPNLFIAGAPKCGTTSLAAWLGTHPQVFMAEPKEPHYFSTDLRIARIETWDEYVALFTAAKPSHSVIGEASTWYLRSKDAVRNIEANCPGARYIVMLRDPVELVRSLHQHNLRILHEVEESLERAWRLQRDRERGEGIPKLCREPLHLQYAHVAALGSQLCALLNAVDPERVLVVDLDAVRASPRATYLGVLSFLGLEDDGRTVFESLNQARLPRSRVLQWMLMKGGEVKRGLGIRRAFGIQRWNETKSPLPAQDVAFLDELREAFGEDQRLLGSLRAGLVHSVSAP